MDISPGNRARQLIELICLSGYATRGAAVDLCGRSVRNIIPNMHRTCEITHNGQLIGKCHLLVSPDSNTLSLSKPAITMMSGVDQVLYEKFKNIYSKNPYQKERLLQFSEINVMMMKAGVDLRADHKPVLQMKFGCTEITNSAYYDSVELKTLIGLKEMGFTRMRGILFGPSSAYVTYFVNKELVKWRYGDEYKMRRAIDDMAKKNFPALIKEKIDYFAVDNALIFGKKQNVMTELFEVQLTRESRKNQNKIGGSRLYDRVYFIPVDAQGIKALKLIAHTAKYIAALRQLFGNRNTAEADLMGRRADNGTFIYPIFTNCISDIIVIREKARQYKDNQYMLYCLPWQLPYLRSFFHGMQNIKFKAYEFNI